MQQLRTACVLAAICGLSLGLSGIVRADEDPATPPSTQVVYPFDSGSQAAPGVFVNGMPETVLSSVEVNIPVASWLRLQFGAATVLSGDPASDNRTFLRITSLKDGAQQHLNAEQLRQWSGTSAYFNGNAVVIELVGFPGTGTSRLVVDSVTAGLSPSMERSICGVTDDRVLDSEPMSARHSVGCTSFLIDDLNNSFLTAGHCGTFSTSVMMFNVPFSQVTGALASSLPTDQYAVDGGSVQNSSTIEAGNDWTYFATAVNTESGLTAAQKQNSWYTLAAAAGPVNTSHVIKVAGYGTVAPPVSPTWNQVGKSATGQYVYSDPLTMFMGGASGRYIGYTVDTTGGNSGAAIFDQTAGKVLGIHCQGGCNLDPYFNTGTAMENSGLQAAIADPRGIAGSGKAAVSSGGLFAIGDGANNFGTLDRVDGGFGKVSRPPMPSPQGLAWDWSNQVFWAVSVTPSSGLRKLWSVNKAGDTTLVALLSGASGTVNGLGYDPMHKTLYGMIASSGQLVTINTSSGVVTTVGAPHGGSVGGLDFDAVNGILYAINDLTGLGSQLETVDTATGVRTVIGMLGAGINDCNGLAYARRGNVLYTINAGTGQLLWVDVASGVATVVGATGGVFGSGFGMGYVDQCPADIDGDGQSDLIDFFAFFNGFDQSTLDADVNLDGEVDLGDFFMFLNFFDQGC